MTTSNQIPEVDALIRFSDDGQVGVDRAGVEGQRRVIQAAAAFHGVRIRREYVVIDVSGRHVADDPQFRELFENMKNPAIAGVIVAEQSRLVRPESFEDWAVLAHFQRNHKLIYTPTGRIDPCTPEGRMTLTMGGFMSGEELHNLRSRFQRGKFLKRLERRHVGGNHMLPRGIRFLRERNAEGKVIGWHWDQDPVEMERMQQAFDLLLIRNEPYSVIAETVGGYQSGKSIRDAMQNPIWIGIRRYEWEPQAADIILPAGSKPGRYDIPQPDGTIVRPAEYTPKPTIKHPKPKKRRHMVRRAVPLDVPTREQLEHGAEPVLKPIMDLQRWDDAQALMAERNGIWRKTKFKNEDRPRFLLMGIAYCTCGQPMYPKYSGRGSHLDSYRCKSRHHGGIGCGAQAIHRDDVDTAATRLLSEQMLQPEYLQAIHEALTHQEPAPDPVRERIDKARADLEEGRKELLAMVRHHDITRQQFNEQIQLLEAELRTQQQLLPPAAPTVDPTEFLQTIANMFASFDRLTFHEKREILKGAMKFIVVDAGGSTAKVDERTVLSERAYSRDSTITEKRATTANSNRLEERARAIDQIEDAERKAKPSESTRIVERAYTEKSTETDERATAFERTKSTERSAEPAESTNPLERALETENIQSRERIARFEESTKQQERIAVIDDSTSRIERIANNLDRNVGHERPAISVETTNHPERAIHHERTKNDERANLVERIETEKRAIVAERTEWKERAIVSERTETNERAMDYERTEHRERALFSESTKSSERARQRDSNGVDERIANHQESTEPDERALPPDSNGMRERAVIGERTRNNERLAIAQERTNIAERIATSVERTNLYERIAKTHESTGWSERTERLAIVGEETLQRERTVTSRERTESRERIANAADSTITRERALFSESTKSSERTARMSESTEVKERQPGLERAPGLRSECRPTIRSITIYGGWLAGANSLLRSRPQSAIGAGAYLYVKLPQPFEIAAIYQDRRAGNGRHVNQIETQFKGKP